MRRKVIGVILVALVLSGFSCAARSNERVTRARDFDADCGAPSLFAFVEETDPRRYDVFTMRGDGTRKRRITRDGASFNPDISPDGRTIVFTSGRHGEWHECCLFSRTEIYLMDVDGRRQRRAFEGTGDDHAVWSPDGRRLAFIRTANRQTSLMLFDTRTEKFAVIVRGREADLSFYDLAWLPDGRHLSYHTADAAGQRWVVVDDRGSSARVLDPELGLRTLEVGEREVSRPLPPDTVVTDQPERAPTVAASWSRNGDLVALPYFHPNDDGVQSFEIEVRDAHRGDLRSRIRDAYSPVWFGKDRLIVIELSPSRIAGEEGEPPPGHFVSIVNLATGEKRRLRGSPQVGVYGLEHVNRLSAGPCA